MKTRKEKTEIPENIPIVTQEMMEKTAVEIAKRRAGKEGSPVEDIEAIECPTCVSNSLSFADDMIFDVTLAGERIVIPNLTGLKCTKCREVAFDARSTRLIEKYTAGRPAGGYECNV